jgi:hypothetical protein
MEKTKVVSSSANSPSPGEFRFVLRLTQPKLERTVASVCYEVSASVAPEKDDRLNLGACTG